MDTEQSLLRNGVIPGLRNGWDGFLWMMKIILPVSFLTDLLAWSGFLQKLDFLFQPLMAFMSLPAMAAYPLLIGVLTNIYGGIAVMAVLPFSRGEMTLMAVFLLIAHNIIQEGIVQDKSGINFWKATLIRLVTATITVVALAPFLAPGASSTDTAAAFSPPVHTLLEMIRNWVFSMVSIGAKIFAIVLAIMTFLEVMKVKGWIHGLVKLLSPFLKVMGLSKEVGFVWLTGVIFGLAYGGSVIIQESKAGHLDRENLEMLHLSIGINHAMIEDPALFLSFGLNPFWLWVPRLIVAILMTRVFTLWKKFARRPS